MTVDLFSSNFKYVQSYYLYSLCTCMYTHEGIYNSNNVPGTTEPKKNTITVLGVSESRVKKTTQKKTISTKKKTQ